MGLSVQTRFGSVSLEGASEEVINAVLTPNSVEAKIITRLIRDVDPNTSLGFHLFSTLAKNAKLSPHDLKSIIDKVDLTSLQGVSLIAEFQQRDQLDDAQKTSLRNQIIIRDFDIYDLDDQATLEQLCQIGILIDKDKAELRSSIRDADRQKILEGDASGFNANLLVELGVIGSVSEVRDFREANGVHLADGNGRDLSR